MTNTDQDHIDTLVSEFFAAFDNRANRLVDLYAISKLFMPEAIISKATSQTVELMSVTEFLQPRHELLNSGKLVDFYEYEVEAKTTIFGQIACRTLRYAKKGTLDGQEFTGEGIKSLHLVNVAGQWRISAIIWQDADALLPITAAKL